MNLITTILQQTFKDIKGLYPYLLLATVPYAFESLGFLFNPSLGVLLIILLTGPFKAGLARISLDVVYKNEFEINDSFIGFTYFKNALGVFLLQTILVSLSFIGCFVIGVLALGLFGIHFDFNNLVMPGSIPTNTQLVFLAKFLLFLLPFLLPCLLLLIWWSQAFFVLAENPILAPSAVLQQSKQLMRGNEIVLVLLSLLFGLFTFSLVLLKLQILSIFILPIQFVALARFYSHIKK